MKKKILLSLAGILCFGMLFSYNLSINENSLEADNIEALAGPKGKIGEPEDGYKLWTSRYNCGFYGSSICYFS